MNSIRDGSEREDTMGARIDDAVWVVDDGGRLSSRRLECES